MYGPIPSPILKSCFETVTFTNPLLYNNILVRIDVVISWVICLVWLKEPEGAFDDEYYVSSVDRAIEEQYLQDAKL